MRKTVIITLLFISIFITGAKASEADIIIEQYEMSGAATLDDALDDETRRLLGEIEITPENLDGLTAENIALQLVDIAKESAGEPLQYMTGIIGALIVAAVASAFSKKGTSRIVDTAVSMCICIMMLAPINEFALEVSTVVKGACAFNEVFAPIYTAILAAAGSPVTAASYSVFVVALSSIITLIIAHVIIPMCTVSLALCLASIGEMSPSISSVTSGIEKASKWLLVFCSIVFCTVISLKTVVTSSTDILSTKTAKFLVSSFVPVVGNALSDAMTTAAAYVKIMKSGVGVFGIVAICYIFIPVIIKNILYIAAVGCCSVISEMLGLSYITKSFKSIHSVLCMLLAVILFSLCTLVISTGVTLTFGGSPQ